MNARNEPSISSAEVASALSKPLRSREKSRASMTGDASRASMSRGAKRYLKPEEITKSVLDAERSSLIEERQVSLEGVFGTHDDMIRELYHMDHFRMMLTYDPQEAKAANTPHFKQYKAPYDLFDKVTADAGPSRRTRGTRSEHLQVVSGLSMESPTLPTKSTRRHSKGKISTAAIHEIISSTRERIQPKEKKLKSQKHIVEQEADPQPSSELFDGHQKPVRKEQGTSATTPDDQPLLPSSLSVRVTPLKRTKSKSHASSINKFIGSANPPEVGLEVNGTDNISTVSLGRRSTRLREHVDEQPTKKAKVSTRDLSNEQSKSLSSAKVYSQKLLAHTEEFVPFVEQSSSTQTESPIKIRRVKLVVRRPPPTLSHHKQRPPPPKFGSSLTNFLTSYRTLQDQDVDADTASKRAEREAHLREREADFHRQGRFIPGTDVLFGTEPPTTPYDPPRRTTKDIWDNIIDTVTAIRSKVPKKSHGQQIAGQIASKIQLYWDSQEARKDKARAQEERRLRALAKATVKLVISEWKKAVYHVREQERLKHEAEERRRGHEHLDAILDQSGQLLETQQEDLTRTRSRSASTLPGFHDWDDEEEEEEEEEEEMGTSEIGGVDEDVGEEDLRQAEDVTSVSMGDDAASVVNESDSEGEDEEDATALLLGPQWNTPTTPRTTPFEPVVNASTEVGTEEKDAQAVLEPEAFHHHCSSSEDVGNVAAIKYKVNGITATSASNRNLSSPKSNEVRDHNARGTGESSVPLEARMDVDEYSGSSNKDIQEETSSTVFEEDGERVNKNASMKGLGKELLEEEEEEEEEEEGEEEEEEEEEKEEEETKKKENLISCETEEDKEPEEEEVMREVNNVVNEIPHIPEYLRPFAVAHVEWNPEEKIKPPLLLRGVLRPYQQSGLEWLASLHSNNLNGILADEMGLGKTIQTIALLAHLACDQGIWGPHLIIVPTSVLLNWEMEFKKFLPGFKVLSYHGSTKKRKELRHGWNDKYNFNVCITSYTLASRDAHIFKRKPWYYMVLDEAHMIKNFKSQRWNILLMFRSFRRLLLTGTPLQNNLTELWALLQFLMSGSNFANLKEFGEWFSNPLEKAIEMGNVLDDETLQRVNKLHTVLRPYLLRRLKRDVEKELPSKFEHLVLCPLSKRQRFLYDEFMSRAQTQNDLRSGVYQKIANILMQLRKVCNHPDLFEVRPIVTSFAINQSAIADFEIKELLIRKRWLEQEDERVDLDLFGFQFVHHQDEPLLAAVETRRLCDISELPRINDLPGEPPPKDTRTIVGFRRYAEYTQQVNRILRWKHIGYLNALKCSKSPIYSSETLTTISRMSKPLLPFATMDLAHDFMDIVTPVHKAILSYTERANTLADVVDRFAFATPPVIALDLPRLALKGVERQLLPLSPAFDHILHRASVKLQIAFPDSSLLQYDCGKLQELKRLLQERKAGGHRVLIFTQMTRILDILEIFLNLHGYLYLRLDGATKIEDRQYVTERFNADTRIFCFIASSRSGGVGINLTGADTVVFYDSDFNPQMDKQCEDRAHRIGQIRDVHIYRFVSQHTVEEAMLRKANQKRSLDEIVIQKGEFDWRTIFNDESALTRALGEFEDVEDAHAAAAAAREEFALEGADNADFGVENMEPPSSKKGDASSTLATMDEIVGDTDATHVGDGEGGEEEEEEEEEEGGTIGDYMIAFVQRDYEFFKDWRL